MQLFVGLGNPGGKYARNRHNVGFMALDRIAEDHGFGPWRGKFQGRLAEGRLGGEKVLLLKPETFMNLSGQSVGAAATFYKLGPGAVTVFHDELDLAPGKVRVKQGGGHAGHNGLRSTHAALGPDYARVRIGIGHPGHKDAVPAYVLHDFPKAQAEMLDDLLRGISDGAADLARGESGKFMNAVSLRVAPPRSGGGTAGKSPARTGGGAVKGPAAVQSGRATPAGGREPASGSPDGAPDGRGEPSAGKGKAGRGQGTAGGKAKAGGQGTSGGQAKAGGQGTAGVGAGKGGAGPASAERAVDAEAAPRSALQRLVDRFR